MSDDDGEPFKAHKPRRGRNHPVEFQFAKGKSGNPKGRPKGSRNKMPNMIDGDLRNGLRIIVAEAERKLTIHDPKHGPIQITTFQASVRSLGLNAAKGNVGAQRAYLHAVNHAEAILHREKIELLQSAFNYKTGCADADRYCFENGLPAPKHIPHPDDVVIDKLTGCVTIQGPLDELEAELWESWKKFRAICAEEVSYFADLHSRARSPRSLKFYLDSWHHAQFMFDYRNDLLPAHHKATLADRSYHQDASREGCAIEMAEERKRRRRAQTHNVSI